jgi:hypothetical protein
MIRFLGKRGHHNVCDLGIGQVRSLCCLCLGSRVSSVSMLSVSWASGEHGLHDACNLSIRQGAISMMSMV